MVTRKSIAMYRGNEIPLLTKLYRGQTNTNRCGLHSHVHEWYLFLNLVTFPQRNPKPLPERQPKHSLTGFTKE